MKPSKAGVLFWGGYLQDFRKRFGQEEIQRQAEEHFGHLEGVEVYEPRLWNDDPKAVVRYLISEGVTHVLSFHYSYGGGHAAPRFAKACDREGIKVVFLGLLDPVRRPGLASLVEKVPFFGKTLAVPFQARSLTPFAKIKIPATVQEVKGLRQENNLPKAHPIKWRGHKWKLPLVDRPDVNHNNIDESPEWVEFVFSNLERVLANLEAMEGHVRKP
jgi:hypothetical protein